jgi:hypothetical protein
MINLTQHLASPEQTAAGVVDLPTLERAKLIALLTVGSLPTKADIAALSAAIAALAVGNATAMVGGAAWMAAPLEAALAYEGIIPFYAFSVRSSVETVVDGKTVKTSIFRHVGFV